MAQLAGVLQTYQDKTRREDLMDRIADISPDMNYLTTILSSVPVNSIFHEWTEYNIARPTSNTVSVEGDDNTFTDLPSVTRLNNITQVIKQVFSVSGTEQVVDKAGPKAAYAREMAWGMKRWKNQWEFASLRGTKASGSSGVAREMNGFIAEVIANGKTTARVSGTSLSEQEFRDININSWNATDEYLIDLILTTGNRKQDFGKFFTNATPKTIAADDKRLVQALDVIENDYGQLVEIRAHKDMPATSVLGVRKSLLHTGVLRPATHVPNGVTGDNIKGHIVGEVTTQIDSSRAMEYRTGYQG